MRAFLAIGANEEKFLKANEHCRFSTIDDEGYPHCVPVSYAYNNGIVHIPTNRSTVKVRHLQRDPKSCVIVDVYERGKGRGVMLRGLGRVCSPQEFPSLKAILEKEMGWRLDTWRIEGSQVDAILLFEAQKVSAIGERFEGQ